MPIDILLKFIFFSIRHTFSDDLSTFEMDQEEYTGRIARRKLYNYSLKNKKKGNDFYVIYYTIILLFHIYINMKIILYS